MPKLRELWARASNNSLLRASLWTCAASVAYQASLTIGITLTARILGSSATGLLGTSLAAGNLVATSLAAGPVVLIIRAAADATTDAAERARALQRLYQHYALGAIATILLAWAMSDVLARLLYQTVDAGAFIFRGVIYGAASGGLVLASGASIGMRDYQQLAVLRLGSGLLQAGGLVVGATIGGATSASQFVCVAATAVAAIAMVATVRSAASSDSLPSASPAPTEAAAAPQRWVQTFAFLAATVAAGGPWYAQSIVARASADGLAQLGLIVALLPWTQVPLLIPAMVGQPLLSELFRASRTWSSQHWLQTRRAISYCALAALAGTTAVLAISPLIAVALKAPVRLVAAALGFACLGAIIQGTLGPLIKVVEFYGRQDFLFVANVGWVLLFIGAAWMFAPTGVVTYFLAQAIAFAAHSLVVIGWALRRGIIRADPHAAS